MSLRLLAQLCFTEDLARQVLDDVDFCAYLQDICQSSTNKDLKKVAQIVLFSLDSKSKARSDTKVRHVLISFHSSAKELCEKIRDELEKKCSNAKVVLNLSNSLKSTIETSMRAIDKSECVLLAVSEKYRKDENSQAEALYAHSLKKHIVPLIFQQGYERVDGWLANIIKEKQCIDFSSFDTEHGFDEAMDKLLNQLNVPTLILGKDVEMWTQAHVAKWLAENGIHPAIGKLYDKCDGVTFKQIYMLKLKTPEFFYQNLLKETDNAIQTPDLALFNARLEVLFEK